MVAHIISLFAILPSCQLRYFAEQITDCDVFGVYAFYVFTCRIADAQIGAKKILVSLIFHWTLFPPLSRIYLVVPI
jgi:hypothetical protein